MFASKALPDRFPYRVGQVRLAYEGTLGGEPTVEDPRPFDPCMNNEPNPVLVAFRHSDEPIDFWMWGFDAEAAFGGWSEWDDPAHPLHTLATSTDDQVSHARTVLNRIVLLGES